MFRNREIPDYIEDKLNKTWPPEQIAKTPCEIKTPSFKTIYRWIYQGYLVKGNVKVLRKKGKTRKRLGNGGKFAKTTWERRKIYNWKKHTKTR